jgi:hypothetical protein
VNDWLFGRSPIERLKAGGGGGGDNSSDNRQDQPSQDAQQGEVTYPTSPNRLKDVTQKFDKDMQQTEEEMTAYAIQLQAMVPGKTFREFMRLFFFYSQVRTGGPKDIKQPGMGYSAQEIGFLALFPWRTGWDEHNYFSI